MSNQDFQPFKILSRLFTCYDESVEFIRPDMKYPLHTQSKPVSGLAAKRLLEAIDAGGAVVNDRMIALAKRIAARRRKAQKHG
jgi:hypothetical protein